ncbi:MAG: glycosyltransferase family 39 protein, partial [Candidatus Zixiibacteriota bacterium]
LAQWEFGDKILHQNGNDADAITFWARVPIILIALLLGLFIFLWTKQLAGSIAALFSALLYFFDPNILAHSHYVTTDIGIAAFIFFAFFFFVKFLEHPSWKNVLWAGLFLGLAQLAKFSAVLLFPIFGMFVVLYSLSISTDGEESPWKKRFVSLLTYLGKYTAIVFVCFVAIWVLYFFNTVHMPGSVIAEIARAQFPNDKLIGRAAEMSIIALSNHTLLKPLAEYFLGVFMVFARVAGGNTYYFLGNVSNHASAWYFPVVFLLKETLPMLFLLILTTGYTLYRMSKTIIGEKLSSFPRLLRISFQSHIAQWLMMFFVFFYSYVSITGNLNIGFRHLFPILPFLYVLVAKTLFDMLKRTENEISNKLLRIFYGGAALIVIAIPVLAYPTYLSYFNPIAGGHENGYVYVTDSNYDWGQDVKRLRNFVEQYNLCVSTNFQENTCQALTRKAPPTKTPIEKIRVDYFGGSSPQFYLGNKYIPWHSYLAPEAGWYAISVGFLQENLYKEKQPGEMSYEWLQAYDVTNPIAKAGDSLFIYYIPEESLVTPQ